LKHPTVEKASVEFEMDAWHLIAVWRSCSAKAKSPALNCAANGRITSHSLSGRSAASRTAKRCVNFAGTLSVVPRTYFLRRDDANLVVFCFAFAERFGGERLPAETRR
jgi:hypothetical protein